MVKITAKVEGMMCPKCEARVNDAVKKALKVKSVESSHEKGETVIVAAKAPEEAAVRAAIEGAGYKVAAVRIEAAEKKGLFG